MSEDHDTQDHAEYLRFKANQKAFRTRLMSPPNPSLIEQAKRRTSGRLQVPKQGSDNQRRIITSPPDDDLFSPPEDSIRSESSWRPSQEVIDEIVAGVLKGLEAQQEDAEINLLYAIRRELYEFLQADPLYQHLVGQLAEETSPKKRKL